MRKRTIILGRRNIHINRTGRNMHRKNTRNKTTRNRIRTNTEEEHDETEEDETTTYEKKEGAETGAG